MFKTILPAAFVAALALCLGSCGNSDKNEVIEFETRADSIGYMVPGFFNGDTAYCATRYSVVWPERIGRQDFEALRDSLTSLTFGVKAETFDRAAQEFMRAGIDEMTQISDTTSMAYSQTDYTTAYNAPINAMQQVNSTVSLLTPKLLVIDVDTYNYYAMAAHGMQTRRFLNYSIAQHRLMTAQNTFKSDMSKELLSLIGARAKALYPDEGVLFDQPITYYNNFRVAEEDIVFVYQPYDIAPYSSGIIEIPVNQYDLYRFLTPEAITALSLD